jgi:lysophospholipase L1-like esterase
MLRRQPREQAMQGLRDIIERIQDSGAMTVVLGLEGAFLLTGDWGEAYEEVARETGSVFVPDILDGVYGNRALMQGDRIHPNAAGYEVITDRIERYAGEWLE